VADDHSLQRKDYRLVESLPQVVTICFVLMQSII